MTNILNKITEAKDENTFLYQLHEESIFDEQLFKEYIEIISLITSENTDRKLIATVIERNVYIVCTAIHHFLPDDLFVIKNFPSNMNEYIEQLRNENSRLLRILIQNER